ncbi:hypothetical protein scyTo_0016583 [Scyliorhinus torazame]|uniref:Uncharacterized protein n=1 Tax=Scyliorhinus torazame TaxID=75743 RepID=A0A401PTX7_SCYTO|nr:hypothetical protein [Scyliorhinus torazame]
MCNDCYIHQSVKTLHVPVPGRTNELPRFLAKPRWARAVITVRAGASPRGSCTPLRKGCYYPAETMAAGLVINLPLLTQASEAADRFTCK